jgi:glucosamine kinase
MDLTDTILIGVDGGGTGCRVAIARAGGPILAQSSGGPANVTSDCDLAIRNVRAAIHDAATSAGLHDLRSATAHIGLAGVTSSGKADLVAAAMPYALVAVTDDRPTTVAGALAGQDGYVVALGTGSIIAASLGDQQRYVGGYGLQVSDQAAGGWLGRKLLEQVLLCHDGLRSHSHLSLETLAQFGGGPEGIIGFVNQASPADYAGLAPQVLAAAQRQDPVAVALMQEGADYLGLALARLGFQPQDRLCLTGGIGAYYAPYLTLQAKLAAPQGTALTGALRLAEMRFNTGF